MTIAKIVREKGPITTSALVEECESDSRLSVAASSVGVMVSRLTRFVRLAPGLYDIREKSGEIARIERARAGMLNERDVRRYCIARYSGEKLSSLYPLWDFEQEKRWAVWGKDALASDLWGSLMWVAVPDEWPKAGDDRPADWAEWKSQGRWRLKVSWQDDLPENLPAVRDVLLVARCARLVGHMTWIRANHILGASHSHERAGLTAVVLGTILGLLVPSGRSRWAVQLPHAEFDREWIDFENLLLMEPNLIWRHPAIEARFNRASLRAAAGDLGWVTVNDVSLLRRLSSTEVISLRVDADEGAIAHSEEGDDIKI
jgi:hypothetical protein